MQEAFKWSQVVVDDFCQPVYEIWLSEAVAMGRIKGAKGSSLIRSFAAWCGAAGSVGPGTA